MCVAEISHKFTKHKLNSIEERGGVSHPVIYFRKGGEKKIDPVKCVQLKVGR